MYSHVCGGAYIYVMWLYGEFFFSQAFAAAFGVAHRSINRKKLNLSPLWVYVLMQLLYLLIVPSIR